jgi:hypothetical protein
MPEYICRECTGRTSEEQTFELDQEPSHCPWCGQSDYLETMKQYLRAEYLRAESDAEYWEEKYRHLREEIED